MGGLTVVDWPREKSGRVWGMRHMVGELINQHLLHFVGVGPHVAYSGSHVTNGQSKKSFIMQRTLREPIRRV